MGLAVMPVGRGLERYLKSAANAVGCEHEVDRATELVRDIRAGTGRFCSTSRSQAHCSYVAQDAWRGSTPKLQEHGATRRTVFSGVVGLRACPDEAKLNPEVNQELFTGRPATVAE